ncbi:hypothetical protein [Cohnella abietis]|uniref:Uncharacterized protein n=1 Tax=Cohnella abietis TaxID=2507935 RepID=A0A3T1D6S5_9BACL|nr:hypothetical protein [Cohnella abietis]BBI33773.1 hypothetical protein KCTCHS21_31720 [Cohnella abietis]
MVGLLTIVGFLVMVGGIILGIDIINGPHSYLGLFDKSISGIKFKTACVVWASGILIGLFFITLGRIVELLENLNGPKENAANKKRSRDL